MGYDAATPPVDLGGTMSLNLYLPHRQAVLRIHHRSESRSRILGLRQLRRRLADAGLTVGLPLELGRRELWRWQGHWVQLEAFVEHSQPPPTWDSYIWLFVAAGRLHRVLRAVDPAIVPRPAIATYGPPSSLRRWLAVTRGAVSGHPAAEQTAAQLEGLVRRLARQWQPANRLPAHLVHGDLRLGNAVLTGSGQAAYLDFGFTGLRPRVHELAYSLFWVILRPDDSGTGANFDWSRVAQFVDAYEEGLRDRLTPTERAALGPYLAAVPLYFGAIAGFTADPAAHLVQELPSIRIAEWVLDHPVLP